ncbi:hypothetical protein B9Z19DRAFT_1135415 [Tuber borchii]|uniref:Uncharacterized protein n=1 Tax=Tuber borchii TaxID=42251 RepID=A0A2T6ZCS1_TUBBO|nr:hypothetical protein B9Z19DRAFT_1135415 [Tuber borchii]
MLPERRPITTFEGEHIHAGTGEPLTSGRRMRSQRDWGNADERAVSNSSDEDETMEDGGKIVPDDRIAGNLSGLAAAIGTSLAPINIPHIPGTASPLSNIGDISESGRERK